MNLQDWIENNLFISQQIQANIISTILIILAVSILRNALIRLTSRRSMDVKAKYQWEKGIGYVTFGVLLLALGSIWLGNLDNLASFLGLMTAGLAIALNGPITDLFGWAFIVIQHPFAVGDRIEVGEHKGDVIDIRFFKFTMLEIGAWVEADQSTGRVIHVPNGVVFKKEVVNFSQGLKYIWDELPILVTFESDWRKAKQVLLEVAVLHCEIGPFEADEMDEETTGGFFITYQTLAPGVFTDIQESGVLLTLRYLVQPRQRRSVRENIVEDVLLAFETHENIDFAYPTMRQVLTQGQK